MKQGGKPLTGVLVFLLVLLPIIGTVVFSYYRIKSNLTEEAITRQSSLSRLSAVVMKERFDRIRDLAVAFSTRVLLHQRIREDKWQEAAKVLETAFHEFPIIDRILLTDSNGILKADLPEVKEVHGKDFSHRDWYKGVSETRKPYLSEVYRRTATPAVNVVAMAVPVIGKNDSLLAYLVLQLRVNVLVDWINDFKKDNLSELFVTDQYGHLAVSPYQDPQDSILDYAAVPSVQRVMKGASGVDILFNPIEKTERLVAYEQVPAYHWGVFVYRPVTSAFTERDHSLFTLQIIYLIIISLGFLFAAAIVRYINLYRKTEARVRQYSDQLERSNKELEQKVEERTRAIQKSEKRLRSTLDTMMEGVQIIGYDWTYLYVNDTVVKQAKCPREELLEHTMIEKYPGIENTEMFLELKRCMAERMVHYMENKFTYPDGSSQWFELSIQPVEEGLFILSVDITKRKNAEEKILELNKNLEQKVVERTSQLETANKELESFSYSVSHDLRAPLRAIFGFSKILQDEFGEKLDLEANRLLGIIMDNAGKMGQLIDDLLAFSRLSRKEIDKSDISMTAMAQQVIHELPASLKGTASYEVRQLPPAFCDPVLMKQVWINLLSNAFKYSSQKNKPNVEIGSYKEEDKNIYYVKDNGAGFDMQYANKLFGVFQRLHSSEEFEGTGVGLAIVHRIVTRHGGKIWAEAKPGTGATFFFYINSLKTES